MELFKETPRCAMDTEVRVKIRPIDTTNRKAFGEELVQALYNHYERWNIHIVSKDPSKVEDHEYKFYVRIAEVKGQEQTPNGLRFEYGWRLDYYIDKVQETGGLLGVTLKQF